MNKTFYWVRDSYGYNLARSNELRARTFMGYDRLDRQIPVTEWACRGVLSNFCEDGVNADAPKFRTKKYTYKRVRISSTKPRNKPYMTITGDFSGYARVVGLNGEELANVRIPGVRVGETYYASLIG
jgi:hypothetical protein